MNFTKTQILLLFFGVFILIQGVTGLGFNIFLPLGFLLVAIALCYRRWWVNEKT